MERSHKSYLLIDSHKFGETAMLTYAQLHQFEGIVTEAMPEERYLGAIEKAGTKLILA